MDINEAEYKAFIGELATLDLSFDSPELKGMDNGDMWLIHRRAEK